MRHVATSGPPLVTGKCGPLSSLLGRAGTVYLDAVGDRSQQGEHLPALEATIASMSLPFIALTARKVAIDTYRENVVYLRRDCPVYRAEGFQALSKVEVTAEGRTDRKSVV